jgi:predicted transcriptional regulator
MRKITRDTYAKRSKCKTCAIHRIVTLANCKRAGVLNVDELAHILQTICSVDRQRSKRFFCAIAVRLRSVPGHDPANSVHPGRHASLFATHGFFT